MAEQSGISVHFGHRPRVQATVNQAFDLTLNVYNQTSAVTLTSGTITVLRPGGAAMPTAVDGEAITIDSGNGKYTLSAAQLANLGADYSARWTVVSSLGTHIVHQLFDVVKNVLWNPVTQADLVKHHADLANILFTGESNYTEQIQIAFEDVYMRLHNKGRRPWLVLGTESIRRPIEHLTLSRIFLERRNESGDRWDLLHDFHQNEYHSWLEGTNFVYDRDQSGTADGTSEFGSVSGEGGAGGGVKWRV